MADQGTSYTYVESLVLCVITSVLILVVGLAMASVCIFRPNLRLVEVWSVSRTDWWGRRKEYIHGVSLEF